MSRPKRLPDHLYTGPAQYFLTFCVRSRARVFVSESIVIRTLLQIRQAARDEGYALLAYCFMPDHLHLLVEGTTETSDLRTFVQVAKRRSGTVYAREWGSRLWQEGYYDRVLRSEESAKRVARYIVNNPVRAGIVTDPRQYPHLGSDLWSVDELLNSIL